MKYTKPSLNLDQSISDCTVLAIDPSISNTGVAFLNIVGNKPMIIRSIAIDALNCTPGIPKSRSTIAARIARIIYTIEQLTQFIESLPSRPQYLAIEEDTNRTGFASTEAGQWLAGAIVTLPILRGTPVSLVTRQGACIACGGNVYRVYCEPAGRTDRQRAEKRARLKGAVITWAQEQFPSFRIAKHSPADREAIADALSVAFGWMAIRREQAAYGDMFRQVAQCLDHLMALPPGSPSTRKRRTDAPVLAGKEGG